MPTTKVGIREFRENLSSYLESANPVAITRHGSTIGIYVPTRPGPTEEDVEAFRVATGKMQQHLKDEGVTEEDLLKDYEEIRRQRRTKKT
jgi:antitoxin (DNA-binding transcriptional repressor) of toxin-antitoxin stability system